MTRISRRINLPGHEAIALASLAVDLRITQIVNRTFGVHALWPDGRLRETGS